MNGKGDKSRPLSVSIKEYGKEFDRIFKKRKKIRGENDKRRICKDVGWTGL